MKKLIGILLVAVMVLSFAACSSDGIVGKWESSFEMEDAILAEMDSETRDEIAEYFAFDELALEMSLQFKDDGTYEIAMDLDKLYDDLYKVIGDGLEDYLKGVLAQQDSDISLDDLLDYLGTDIEELTDETMEEFDIDDLAEDITTEGCWMVEGNMLYMSDGLDEEPDDGAKFELDGNKLTIFDDEITLVFNRVR